MGYIDSMYDVMSMETAMLKYVMDYLRNNYAHEIEILGADIPVINEIPCVTLLEVKGILGSKGSKTSWILSRRTKLQYANMQRKPLKAILFCNSLPFLKTAVLCYE